MELEIGSRIRDCDWEWDLEMGLCDWRLELGIANLGHTFGLRWIGMQNWIEIWILIENYI